MKKLLLVSLICFYSFFGKAQVTYPNVQTNFINTIAVIQQFLLTNVTFINNMQNVVLNPLTNVWAGPTNIYDLSTRNQYYESWTSTSITGYIGLSNSVVTSSILTLKNLSATNQTLTLLGNVTTDDGARIYYVTNGTYRVVSLRYTPNGPQTNVVTRLFF